MYGTIARLKVAPENRNKLESALSDWERERAPKVKGAAGEYLLWPDADGGTAYLVAMFEDEQRYRENAASPEQDAWYRRFRSMLEGDPEWIDGEITPATS